jgi:hypothetical protein
MKRHGGKAVQRQVRGGVLVDYSFVVPATIAI